MISRSRHVCLSNQFPNRLIQWLLGLSRQSRQIPLEHCRTTHLSSKSQDLLVKVHSIDVSRVFVVTFSRFLSNARAFRYRYANYTSRPYQHNGDTPVWYLEIACRMATYLNQVEFSSFEDVKRCLADMGLQCGFLVGFTSTKKSEQYV